MLRVICCNQKTAYDLRISDWSSDVCASDLQAFMARQAKQLAQVVNQIGQPMIGRQRLNGFMNKRVAGVVLVNIAYGGMLLQALMQRLQTLQVLIGYLARRLVCTTPDRKSTRLNSSH